MGKRLTGLAICLLGIVHVASSLGLVYILNLIESLLETIKSMPTYGLLHRPRFEPYITFGWCFIALELVVGLVSLVAGIAVLTKREERAVEH